MPVPDEKKFIFVVYQLFKIKPFVRILIICLTFLFFSCSEADKPEKVTVAVAANLQFAMKEIALEFEKKHHIKVEVSSGSSGTLTTQIKHGAPFDLFVSANLRYPNKLFKDGMASKKPKTYAFGSLIMWSTENQDFTDGIESLKSSSFLKIAVANSETAPYGIAALEALETANLLTTLDKKLVYGESVGQVNQYVKSGAVDVGLTSKSVLFSLPESERGSWGEIDPSLYTPIEQGIVMLKQGEVNNLENATLFYDFMFSDQVKEILKTYGYDIK